MVEVAAEPPVVVHRRATVRRERRAASNGADRRNARRIAIGRSQTHRRYRPGPGKEAERLRHFTYRQLAVLGDADIERIEAAIKSFGRIPSRRLGRSGQEQHLLKYQEAL